MQEPKNKLVITLLPKPARIPKEKVAELKGVASSKSIARMKQEGVLCPMSKESISFINCFICDKFVRRIKGYVHCNG